MLFIPQWARGQILKMVLDPLVYSANFSVALDSWVEALLEEDPKLKGLVPAKGIEVAVSLAIWNDK